ncbi:MAG: AAA family ATPase [Candidatus Sungiibacteriota bacterium]
MKDLIIISGAPGSGKSTIAKLLQEKLKSPYIDFGWMREWHLLSDWSDQSKEEESMAFDNLVYLLRNYIKHGYKNILVTDLQEGRVKELTSIFSVNELIVVSLIVDNDEELKKRVLGERDSGFKNFEASIAWNRLVLNRSDLLNEYKLDNTHNNPIQTADQILELLV